MWQNSVSPKVSTGSRSTTPMEIVEIVQVLYQGGKNQVIPMIPALTITLEVGLRTDPLIMKI